MQGSVRIAFAVLSLRVFIPLHAQEQPPVERLSAGETTVVSAEASPGPAEQMAVAAANREIQRRLTARSQPLPEGASVEAVSAIERPSGGYDVVFRYRVDWIEWSHSQPVTESDAGLVADVAATAGTVDLSRLEVQILTREDAERILKACNALLTPTVKPLRPPFRHRLTNVYWDADTPFLQSSARIPGSENDCIRADLNLVTGQSTCRDMACAVR